LFQALLDDSIASTELTQESILPLDAVPSLVPAASHAPLAVASVRSGLDVPSTASTPSLSTHQGEFRNVRITSDSAACRYSAARERIGDIRHYCGDGDVDGRKCTHERFLINGIPQIFQVSHWSCCGGLVFESDMCNLEQEKEKIRRFAHNFKHKSLPIHFFQGRLSDVLTLQLEQFAESKDVDSQPVPDSAVLRSLWAATLFAAIESDETNMVRDMLTNREHHNPLATADFKTGLIYFVYAMCTSFYVNKRVRVNSTDE
jgi:hypothetical protein